MTTEERRVAAAKRAAAGGVGGAPAVVLEEVEQLRPRLKAGTGDVAGALEQVLDVAPAARKRVGARAVGGVGRHSARVRRRSAGDRACRGSVELVGGRVELICARRRRRLRFLY